MGKALRPATSLPSNKFIKKCPLKKRAQNISKKQDIIDSYLRNLSSNFGNSTATRQYLKRKHDTNEPEYMEHIPKKLKKTDTELNANVADVTENTKFQYKTKYLQSEEEIRDLFYIDELKNSNEHTFHLDWLFHICDEISLEGLDGITIEALWSRMKNISYLPVLLEGKEELFWNLIKYIGDIEYHILETPREKLIIYDRNSCVCPDTGIVIEPMTSHDIYPYSMVNNASVKGSCATYYSRNENTDIILNLSLDEAFQVYGNRLVIVASQRMRDNAIISEISSPNLELVDNEYGLLERVGRSRNFGELTQGRVSILNMIKDSRSIFHIRKSLEKKKLLKKQFFILRSLTASQNKTGKLLHLPRFYRVQKSKTLLLIEEVVELLRHKPGYSLEFGEFKKYFPRSTGVNKIMKMAEFNKYIRTDIFRPYRYLYPNATTTEWKYKNKDKEKVLRIFQLIDPTVNVSACWDATDNEQNSDDEIVDNEDPGRKMITSEFLKEVFLFIYNEGIKGVTLQDLEKKIELDYYTIRIAVRKLQAKNVIDSVRSEHGKQRHIIYFARCFHSKKSKELPPPEPLKLPDNILKKILQQQANAIAENRIANPSSTVTTSRPTFSSSSLNLNGKKYFKIASRPLPFQCGIIKMQPPCIEMLVEEETFYMGNYFKQLFSINLNSEKLHTKFFPFVKRKCNKNHMSPVLSQILISYSSDDLPMKFALLNSLISGTNLNILDILEGKNESVNINDSIDFEALTDDRRSIAFKISQSNSKDYLLGPSPEILLEEKTQDNIDVTIVLSTRPKEYIMDYTTYTTFDKKVTSLSLFRINTILNLINLNNVVCDIYKLQKSVVDIESESSESKIGQGKIDKNTLNRILLKLVSEGYIKIFKIVMTTPEKFKAQWLITHPRIELNNPLLKTLQERMKLKFFLGLDKNQKVAENSSPFDSYEATASLNKLKEMSNIKPNYSYKVSRKFGRLLGYQPKFVRLQLLHELLYYLIRDYQPADKMSHTDIEEVLLHYAPEEFREIPPIYRKGIDWKMFISPLPSHKGWDNGWALLCDVILAIPLSLWVKLFHTSLECQELFAYMEHPIKRHYLIKDIPLEFRHVIMYKKRYLQNAVELLYRLCFIGLVQLGPQSPQMKDQIFLYVNKKATLLDTSTSAPSYHKVSPKKYKQITFNFSTRNDVEEYWCQLWTISMNTPLGQRTVMEGKSVAIENPAYKQVLLDSLKSKTPEQAKIKDTGEVPGDKQGAAGLDSSMWSHIKRNWLWSSKSTKHYDAPIRKKDINLRNANIAGIQPISIKYRELMNQNRKIFLPNDIDQFEQLDAVNITKRRERASIVHRKISLKKFGSSKRKTYYDAKDKTILKNLGRTFRANWSQKEDRILLICKAASYLLSANLNKELIPFKVVRDVLHILVPKSKDKTTSACIRRILRLWKIDPVMKRIKENVNNLINFMVISKYFSPIIYYTNKSTVFKCPYTSSEITIAYAHLVSYMYQNLTSIENILQGHLVTLDYLAPNRIDTFSPILIYTERDNIVSTNPTSEDAIKKCVIRSVLVSSLNSSKMGQNTSYQLFKICTKFPDNLIRSAVWSLKNDQIISLNKKSRLKSSVIKSMPFQLSVSYSHMQKTTYNTLTFHTIYQSYLEIIEANPMFAKVDRSKALFRYSGLLAKNELATIWSNINYTFNIPEAAFILNPYIKDRTTLIRQLATLYQQYLKDLAAKRLQQNSSQSTEAIQTEQQEPVSCAVEKNKRLEVVRQNVSRLLISLPCLCNKKISENNEPFMKTTDEIDFNNYLSVFIESLITVTLNLINSVPDAVKFLQNIIQRYHRNKILDSTTKELEARLFKMGHLVREFLRNHQLPNIKECFENEFPEKNSKCDEMIRAWLEKTKINAPKSNSDVKVASLKNSNVHHSFFKCNKPKYDSDSSVPLSVRQDGQSDAIPEIEDIIEGMMLPPDNQGSRHSPHISELASLLCKDKFSELTEDEKLLDELKNHFIIQYPVVEGFLVEKVEQLKNLPYLKIFFDTKKKGEFKEKVQRYFHIEDPNKLGMLEQIKLNGGSIPDIRITEELVTYVYNKGSTGCSGQLLKEMFADKMRNVNLITVMNILTDMYILIRTGATEILFVHNEFASIWLVETFHLSPQENHILQASAKDYLQKLRQKIESRIRSTKQMRVLLMPWIRIDGTLNLPLFEKWLTLVLSYCLNNPSCPVTTIFNKFYLVKPVEIFFLLEILQDLNCLKIYMNETSATSIFSPRVEKISRPATFLDSFNDMYVELHTLSSICMGYYLDREGIEFI